MARISEVLQDRLRTASPDDWIEVVVEIAEVPSAHAPSADRLERLTRAEQQFTASNQDVIQSIQHAGGEVLDKSWLSGAIKARVRVNDIERLLSLDRVELIDLPRRLTRS
jgi:hypothetical protein